MKDINFYIPDFYYKNELNILLVRLIKEHPECFYNNVKIGAFYGSFPNCIWNGGRVCFGFSGKEQVEETINTYYELNIPLRFTFTNCLIEEKHLDDYYCNMILELANNKNNEILVNSPILEKYLRENYPNYKFILSTTRCERNIDKINEACEKYFLVVPDSRDNNNPAFFNQLKHKDKVELLTNPYCDPNCSYRKQHYTDLSRDQLELTQKAIVSCEVDKRSFFDITNMSHFISTDLIYKQYVPLGFEHFKIEGRTVHILDLIESYVYFLVKPEFKDQIRYVLIKSLWR